MKNHTLLISLTILGFLTFWSCQETGIVKEQPNEEYSQKVRKIIEEKNAQIVAAYSSGLIDSAALHFANNSIQMPPNQPALIGLENYKKAWNQNMQFGKWEFDLQTQEVKANGHLAVELGKYTLSFTPNENSPIPAMKDKGNYVVLWEKINEDWKVMWDAPVSELPMQNPVIETKSDN
jgi:ketosteroid isomerase-like protein